ncbi:NfeD family protein [Pseudonocardia yunnanensis]|uniref:NfeD family protein n=1 Tax=Pseudonocardia yunnanensis TaxID=58107 RepID=A0ABW4FAD0_9PSEU
MDPWILWLTGAVVLGIAEAFTLTAVSGLLAGASLVTAVVAAIGLPVPLQVSVFAVAATAGIVVLRRAAARHGPRVDEVRFGVAALPGRTGYVVDDVTGRAGTVRIGGEDWTARALDETGVIPVGRAVDVIRIDGATAVVHSRE